MIVTVKDKQGSTTTADANLGYALNLQVTRSEVEKAVGRKLRNGDVVEVTVDGQTYRCTISMRPRGRVLGILVGVNGQRIEHSLRIENGPTA